MLIYCYFNQKNYITWCFVDVMKIHPTRAQTKDIPRWPMYPNQESLFAEAVVALPNDCNMYLVYSHLTYALLAWGRWDVLMLLRLSVLTGEHANYSQIITRGPSFFTQFMNTMLYYMLSTQIPLIFINISKANYLLINHLICTTPDTEQIVILILQYLIIQKLNNVILIK